MVVRAGTVLDAVYTHRSRLLDGKRCPHLVYLDILCVRSPDSSLLESGHLREPVFPLDGSCGQVCDVAELLRLVEKAAYGIPAESIAHQQQVSLIDNQVHRLIRIVPEFLQGATYFGEGVECGHDLELVVSVQV